MNSINSSKSLNKRKKGLSLSLEKGNKNKDQNQQTAVVFKDNSLRRSFQSKNTSVRKNKIKFAQSYQQYQSGSKFKRQNYFKITDQDIKLGGNKKVAGHQRKILNFQNTNSFGVHNSKVQVQSGAIGKFPYFTQRKGLRESKVVSLTSNINYFQSMSLHRQNLFCFSQIEKGNTQPISGMSVKATEVVGGVGNQSEERVKQRKIEEKLGCKLEEQDKEGEIKQSSDKFRIQKLKQVQIDIDQLLAKASQTRAMLLR